MNETAWQTKSQSQANPLLAPSILRRKCECGSHTMAGGECAECARSKNRLQRKLTIGASNDSLEQEADRVADQVMAKSAHSGISDAALRIQRYSGQTTGGTNTAPTSVDRVLASSGRPLEPALQQDMEQRFGYDFSRVRVHSGPVAEQSAREVNARAYTVGHNIVFGAGQLAPETNEGRRLLAHELTHTIQQGRNMSRARARLPIGSNGDNGNSTERQADQAGESVPPPDMKTSVNFAAASNRLQRACEPMAIGSVGGCTGRGGDIVEFGGSSDRIFLFEANCDDLKPGEDSRLRELAAEISSTDSVDIDGFASEEGDATFNEDLSCARAHRAEQVLAAEGVTASMSLFKHGATPGGREERRSVVITLSSLSSANGLKRINGSPASISWIDANSPAGDRVTDPMPSSTITESFATGNSGFRFSNYLNAWCETRDDVHIDASDFHQNSGIYRGPSLWGIPSHAYDTRRSAIRINEAGIEGVQFMQLAGARTISPGVIGGTVGAGVGIGAGAWGGAKVGTTIGSFGGPIGTAGGAIIGAGIGAVIGWGAGSFAANRITNFPPIWTRIKLRLFANGNRSCELVEHSLFPSNNFYCDFSQVNSYSALATEQRNWENNGWDKGNPWGVSRPSVTP